MSIALNVDFECGVWLMSLRLVPVNYSHQVISHTIGNTHYISSIYSNNRYYSENCALLLLAVFYSAPNDGPIVLVKNCG